VTKVSLRGLVRDEKGQALILALILLVIGGLIMAPLLAYMSTGIIAGGVYEKKADELYAADAGAEDAVWKIQDGTEVRPPSCITDPTYWNYSISDVNGKSVAVTITYNVTTHTYHIVSTATGDGSGTKIEAWINTTITYYAGIMDQLVTVEGVPDIKDLEQDLGKLGITCPTACTDCGVCGKAYDYAYYDNIPAGCRGCVAVYNFPAPAWPTVDSLSAQYWKDVASLNASSQGSITLNGNSIVLGPLKRLGALTISGTGTVTLDGTLYITGKTVINGQNDNNPIRLKLNRNTIYVNSTASPALDIKQCIMEGPGVIIAVGDINFAPKIEAGMTDPIFVLSVQGTTTVQPSGTVYGAIAGKVDVEIKQGSNPSFHYPADGFGNLTLPYPGEAWRTYSIASWEVKPA
jgi:hypothetical protein